MRIIDLAVPGGLPLDSPLRAALGGDKLASSGHEMSRINELAEMFHHIILRA